VVRVDYHYTDVDAHISAPRLSPPPPFQTYHVRHTTYPLLILLVLLALPFAATRSTAQLFDSVRIATWHLRSDTGAAARAHDSSIRRIIHLIRPDILLTQGNAETGVQSVLPMLLALGEIPGGQYSAVEPVDGPGTDPACYFNTFRLDFLGAHYIASGGRMIGEYHFATRNYHDTIILFDLHLSEGIDEQSRQRRRSEVLQLRGRIDTLLVEARAMGRGDTLFLVAGDLNVGESDEPAYRDLLAPLTDGGALVDPISRPGAWSLDSSHASLHTAFTHSGMAHRFDQIVISPRLMRNYRPGSYTAFGNDGKHFSDSINRRPNLAVPDSIADALHDAADHLPLHADFVFGLPPAGIRSAPGDMMSTISIFPQPASDHLSLKIETSSPGPLRVRLISVTGETIIDRDRIQADGGATSVRLYIRSLPWGVFFYLIDSGGETTGGTIIVAR
jgi:hypothetical protein